MSYVNEKKNNLMNYPKMLVIHLQLSATLLASMALYSTGQRGRKIAYNHPKLKSKNKIATRPM